MSYLVIAAMTKKGSHALSVMHVALSLFLELISIFCQIPIERYCLDALFYLFLYFFKNALSHSHAE